MLGAVTRSDSRISQVRLGDLFRGSSNLKSQLQCSRNSWTLNQSIMHVSAPIQYYIYLILSTLFALIVTIRPRKVDFVLAVGIWVGFGPELGSEKISPKINKKLIFMHSISQIYP